MQLKQIFFIALFSISNVFSQEKLDEKEIQLEDISVDFAFSYYNQNGKHSAVTGGEGTEKLYDIAPSLSLYIPIDAKNIIQTSGGFDYYSSASSDNINNPFLYTDHISSASRDDIRGYGSLLYIRKNLLKNTSYKGGLGFSFEFDVSSVSFFGGFTKDFKNKNASFSILSSYFFDSWRLIYPIEHRNGDEDILSNKHRHSLNVSLLQTWNMNKRMNASINFDFTSQFGLLSTPFQRVYMQNYTNSIDSKVEQLPTNRIKLPLAFRWNINPLDFMLIKMYYRFYYDTWQVLGNTIELELPFKIKSFMRLYPFYRIHFQKGSKYFAAKGKHLNTELFYTSDFDLSSFISHKVGLGIQISPSQGVFHFKSKNGKRINFLKSLNFRYAHYMRSDGLRANVFSFAMSYHIKR